MNKFYKIIKVLNFKTIYFNFKYLPIKQAIKFPILLSRKVYLKNTKGEITINGKLTTGMIKIGLGDMGIFDEIKSRSIWNVFGKIIFNGTANIGHGSKISVDNEGVLIIGNNFNITAETTIVANLKIEFGNNCLLSWDTLIMDDDFHKIINQKGEIINNPKEITIGNNVWIGCRNLILKGAKIPDNSIIGAGSVVSKKIDFQNSIYAGNPLTKIKDNIIWEL